VLLLLLLLLGVQLLQAGGGSCARSTVTWTLLGGVQLCYLASKSASTACHAAKAGTCCCKNPLMTAVTQQPRLHSQPQNTLQSHLDTRQRRMPAQGDSCSHWQAGDKKLSQRIYHPAGGMQLLSNSASIKTAVCASTAAAAAAAAVQSSTKRPQTLQQHQRKAVNDRSCAA
jgi:hypothetical protein